VAASNPSPNKDKAERRSSVCGKVVVLACLVADDCGCDCNAITVGLIADCCDVVVDTLATLEFLVRSLCLTVTVSPPFPVSMFVSGVVVDELPSSAF